MKDLCPRSERLVRYLENRLEPGDREAVEEHLSRCRSCRRRLVESYESGAEPIAVEAPEELKRQARSLAPRRARPARRWAALAAVLIAGLGLSWLLFEAPRESPDPETWRAPSASDVELVAPEAGASVAPGSVRFRWRPVPGARRYTLSVVDPLGDVVRRETTTEPSVSVAAGVFEEGGEYFWYVRVFFEDGTSLETGVRPFFFGR